MTDGEAGIIRAEEVGRSFGDIRVLDGLNLEVRQGEFLTIVGKSGAGKSTLLSILGTHDLQHRGRLFVAGRDTSQLSSNQLSDIRRNYIGYVFQDFHLMPQLTAMENVVLPAVFSGEDLAKAKKHATDVLEKLSIRNDDTRTSLLSRGERQRVAVARGLVNRPSVLMADEPSASLDQESEETLFDLLDTLRKEQGFSLIAVVHSNAVLERSDRIMELKEGRLHETG